MKSRIRIRRRHQQLVLRRWLRRRFLRFCLLRRRLLQQLRRPHATRSLRCCEVSPVAPASGGSALRSGPLLSAEQLQSRLLRPGRKCFHRRIPDNTVFTIPPSATRSIGDDTYRQGHFVEVLRRSVERLCGRWQPESAALQSAGSWSRTATSQKTNIKSTTERRARLTSRPDHHQRRRVLQHLQPVPVRHLHHGQLQSP